MDEGCAMHEATLSQGRQICQVPDFHASTFFMATAETGQSPENSAVD